MSASVLEIYARKFMKFTKNNNIARLTTEMYLSDMVPAMKPTEAFAKMAHKEIERVAIDDLEGRITAVLLTHTHLAFHF
jgi:arginine decarboxylase